MSKFFSVIIPVYNVEKYLNQCVDSVLSQTFSNFEIILVDDGSTDNSPKICDEYQQLDSRIITIHKENGGASSARNEGLKIAKGEYILFLDSDDYWDSNDAINEIYSVICANNCDIVSFSSKLLFQNGTFIEDGFNYPVQALTNGTCKDLEFMISNNLIIGSVCSKAIKKEYIINNNLFFKEGIKCEDIDWIIRASCLLPRYIFLNNHFYIYRKQREGSSTASVNEEHIRQYLTIIVDFCNKKEKNDNKIFEKVTNYVAFHYLIVLGYIANIKNKTIKKQIFKTARNYKWLFQYNLHPKVRTISKIYKFMGFNITSFLLGQYIRKKNAGKI